MLRIAILGAGAISDSHIQSYLSFQDRCRIVALADLYTDKATEKAAKHGLSVAVFADHTQMLAAQEFDAASICLPPFAHASAAVDLLRAGKHVLVEKPMATCLQECDAMLVAAQESGRVLSVVSQNRFKTPMMKMKQVLGSGLIGNVLHSQVDSFWWRGRSYYDLWWRGTWEKEGGGCTMNHAVHHIDIFQWLMGMPAEALAIAANLAHDNSEVEDFSTAVLRYADGSIGQITASLVHHGEEQQILVQGERAAVAVPWRVMATKQKGNGFPEEDTALRAELLAFYEALPALPYEGHDGQIDNFLNAIEGREPLLVDGNQGRRTLELITAIYLSAHLGRPTTLPLAPSALFYARDGILRNARHFHEKTRNVERFGVNDITLGRHLGQ